MPAIDAGLPVVYLHPGEFHIACTPSILKTVLGSCVGVSFWFPRLGLGALCHGILPHCPQGTEGEFIDHSDGFRYVDFAICELLRQFASYGGLPSDLELKIFGGADVLPVIRESQTRRSVGSQNLAAADEVIKRESLRVLASDVGGSQGRFIRFHTGTGEVLLQRLARLPSEERLAAERALEIKG
jgi:chemotaxis protein CheD